MFASPFETPVTSPLSLTNATLGVSDFQPVPSGRPAPLVELATAVACVVSPALIIEGKLTAMLLVAPDGLELELPHDAANRARQTTVGVLMQLAGMDGILAFSLRPLGSGVDLRNCRVTISRSFP